MDIFIEKFKGRTDLFEYAKVKNNSLYIIT
jgi:hypothetical protein